MTFDLRDRCGVSINDVGERVTFGEAWMLVQEMRDQPGTRTHASVNDWAWPATFQEIAAINHAEWYMNVHRMAGFDPVVLPRPWTKPTQKVDLDVTPEERAALTAQLEASTVWSQ